MIIIQVQIQARMSGLRFPLLGQSATLKTQPWLLGPEQPFQLLLLHLHPSGGKETEEEKCTHSFQSRDSELHTCLLTSHRGNLDRT